MNLYEMYLTKMIEKIELDSELESEIKNYTDTQVKIDQERAKIQLALDSIDSMETSNKTRFRDMEKYMKRFSVDQKKVDGWVAKLTESLKYSTPRPDYKKLWLETLTKVNTATKNVMNSLKESQMEFKKTEKQIKLDIQQEGIVDIFKTLFSKPKKLFSSFNLFNKLSNKLPKI